MPPIEDRAPAYGPDNPHPLSTMRTELVWEGKYDEYGDRRGVDAAGLAMPLQRIETIDEPRSAAAADGPQGLLQFESSTKRVDDFRNRLIWGDNKLVLASLLQEFRGKVDLIYIDPPFDVGADFSMKVGVGDERDTISKEQSTLEMVAYRDMWGRGSDSYLEMLASRLELAHELLSPKGSMYLHIGPGIAPYAKVQCDRIFGTTGVSSEIVWQRVTAHGDSKRWGTIHDYLLFYSKSEAFTWNPQFAPYSKEYIETKYNKLNAEGRRYMLDNMTSPNPRPNMTYTWRGCSPPAMGWRYQLETMERLFSEGRIELPKKPGGRPRLRRFLDEMPGVPVGTVWSDIPPVNSQAHEDTGYDTQKPHALLERVLSASTDEGDLVLDFFCGSGTTAAVAERLGRRWIAADLGRFAVHTTRKRLIGLQRELHEENEGYRAFDVYNLGRYERQWWQKERLAGADEEHRRVVLEFFRAETLVQDRAPSPLIHGRKGSSLCHVDGIDSIFTRDEAADVARATAAAGAKECFCLAWEFEMDLRLAVQSLEKELGVKLKLVQIPREIMERNRTGPPPFLEVASLGAAAVLREPEKKGGLRPADIKLTNFLPSLAEVPPRELETIKERAIRSGFDFIDFWAIDFDWHPEKPFNHHWQDYRTRKDRSLKTVSDSGFIYPSSGTYTACVKVVDVFGSDTSITVEVKV